MQHKRIIATFSVEAYKLGMLVCKDSTTMSTLNAQYQQLTKRMNRHITFVILKLVMQGAIDIQ